MTACYSCNTLRCAPAQVAPASHDGLAGPAFPPCVSLVCAEPAACVIRRPSAAPQVYTLGRRTAKEARRIAGATGGGAPTSGSGDVGGAGAAGLRLSHPELRFDEAFLSEHGASVAETQRGGQVTYHGPGQLVGYPVVHLRQLARRTRDRTLSPSGYIPAIEEALCAALGQLGVQGARGRSAEGAQNTGLWVRAPATVHGFAGCTPLSQPTPAAASSHS